MRAIQKILHSELGNVSQLLVCKGQWEGRPAHTRVCCVPRAESGPGDQRRHSVWGLRQRAHAWLSTPWSRRRPCRLPSLSTPASSRTLLGCVCRARVYIYFPVLSHQGLPLATVYVFLLFIAFLSNPLPQVLSAVLLLKCILNFVLFLFW